MRDWLRKLKPTCISDLVAMNALYRPGPMEMIGDFIARKHGSQKISSLHPKLEPILKETYGVIVYQEQVMKIASEVAGFTLAKADLMRRAMGKKDAKAMADHEKGVRRRRRETGRPAEGGGRHLRPDREVREVRLQQVAQRRLFHHRLSDRVSEGALSGRIHGRDALLGNREHGQDRPADRRLPEGGDPGPSAGRQRERQGFHGRQRRHPLRAGGDQECRGARHRERGAGADGRTVRSRTCSTSARASTSGW